MNSPRTKTPLILSLHKLIEEKKEIDRISWDNLGDMVGYSGVGLKKALKNKSLSLLKLEEIIVKLKLTKEAKNLGLDISDRKFLEGIEDNIESNFNFNNDKTLKSKKDLDKLESLVLSNWDVLMKRKSFKEKVEATTMKDINKILDERLAVILKNIK